MSTKKMSKAARSLYIFSLYLFFVAFLQLCFPSYLIQFMGPQFPASAAVFVQFSGMLFLFLAFYYIEAALHELTDLLRWTIYTRASTILFFAYFVIFQDVSPLSLMFGVIDFAGAAWTYFALRASRSV